MVGNTSGPSRTLSEKDPRLASKPLSRILQAPMDEAPVILSAAPESAVIKHCQCSLAKLELESKVYLCPVSRSLLSTSKMYMYFMYCTVYNKY